MVGQKERRGVPLAVVAERRKSLGEWGMRGNCEDPFVHWTLTSYTLDWNAAVRNLHFRFRGA